MSITILIFAAIQTSRIMAPHFGQIGRSFCHLFRERNRSERRHKVNGVLNFGRGVPVARRPGVAANSDGGSSRGSRRGGRLGSSCERCGTGTRLFGIEAERPGHELHTSCALGATTLKLRSGGSRKGVSSSLVHQNGTSNAIRGWLCNDQLRSRGRMVEAVL